jgi:aspartate aminotransferase
MTKSPLAQRMSTLEESQTLEMARRARELKAKGIHVISLNLGEPDFQTPQHIKDAAKNAIDKGYSFYTPVAGILELREAIAQKFITQNNIETKAENIVVSTGAKQTITNLMLSLIDKGDEVIVIAPYWVSYTGIVALAEGVPVLVKAGIEQEFKVTAAQIRAAITPKTKAIIFSSPCNPTGAVFSEQELRDIAKVLEENPNIYVIADEIYEYINFTGKHFSIGSIESIKDRVATVNGFSKGFAMTGWRVGYATAPLWWTKACDKVQGQITSGTCSIAQHAALAAISQDLTPTREMEKTYHKRLILVKGLLEQIEGVKTNSPQGAFYLFPDVSAYFGKSFNGEKINNCTDLCNYLLLEGHLSLVMGDAFGDPNCIRISYAASDEDLIEGMKRLKNALYALK